jgi:hypothetical protein
MSQSPSNGTLTTGDLNRTGKGGTEEGIEETEVLAFDGVIPSVNGFFCATAQPATANNAAIVIVPIRKHLFMF